MPVEAQGRGVVRELAVDRSDPAGTERALARKGFRVEWVLVTDGHPTNTRNVPAPPAGTEIIAVLNAKGGNEVSDSTRVLQIEVAPRGSRILEEHR